MLNFFNERCKKEACKSEGCKKEACKSEGCKKEGCKSEGCKKEACKENNIFDDFEESFLDDFFDDETSSLEESDDMMDESTYNTDEEVEESIFFDDESYDIFDSVQESDDGPEFGETEGVEDLMSSEISEDDIVPDSVTRLGTDLTDFDVDDDYYNDFADTSEDDLDDPDIDNI